MNINKMYYTSNSHSDIYNPKDNQIVRYYKNKKYQIKSNHA